MGVLFWNLVEILLWSYLMKIKMVIFWVSFRFLRYERGMLGDMCVKWIRSIKLVFILLLIDIKVINNDIWLLVGVCFLLMYFELIL